MDSKITILWPSVTNTGIEDKDFTSNFCRNMSYKLCKADLPDLYWVDYKEDRLSQEISSSVQGMVIIITDPEIVLPPLAVSLLLETLQKDVYSACGPVYNFSDYPHQNASIPAPYFTLSSFMEVSHMVAQKNSEHVIPVPSLDPACILFRDACFCTAFLSHADTDLLTSKDKMAVHSGALVQRFTNSHLHGREDLVRLVPPGVQNVLDIGCAGGGYGRTLKKKNPALRLVGIEPNPQLTDTTLMHYDEIISGDIEQTEIEEKFDLINCGDVIEHLFNPWKTLKKIHDLLAEKGCLILSVPNVAHWSMINELLQGDFQYLPAGLLCRSHIRWFTEITICEALEEAGFSIDLLQRGKHPATPAGDKLINTLVDNGYGDRELLLTNEFLIRAVKKWA